MLSGSLVSCSTNFKSLARHRGRPPGTGGGDHRATTGATTGNQCNRWTSQGLHGVEGTSKSDPKSTPKGPNGPSRSLVQNFDPEPAPKLPKKLPGLLESDPNGTQGSHGAHIAHAPPGWTHGLPWDVLSPWALFSTLGSPL